MRRCIRNSQNFYLLSVLSFNERLCFMIKFFLSLSNGLAGPKNSNNRNPFGQRPNKAIVAMIVALLSLNVYAKSSIKTLLVSEKIVSVACCDFHGTPDQSVAAKKKQIVYWPGAVVVVLKIHEDKVLLHDNDIQNSGWFAASKLTDASEFSPIHSWKGQSMFSVGNETSGVTLKFSRSGTFSAYYRTAYEGDRKWSGRLYQYKQFIWARSYKKETSFDQWSIFQVMKNGNLCVLRENWEPLSECRESDGISRGK
jgi:hypothetical protein